MQRNQKSMLRAGVDGIPAHRVHHPDAKDTKQEEILRGGISYTSDYSVSSMDNWVERANKRPRVVKRVRHA